MPVRLKTEPYVKLKAQPKEPPLAPVARGSKMKEEKSEKK
tara:strand:- start:324 stop:443 length:120 start_codon:yes stop_codon:yes gene_type:complete